MDQASRAEDVSRSLRPPDERQAELERRLGALGIGCATHAHAPVFTVEEAQALRGALPGGHTKNLFLRDRGQTFWLVVLREDLRVDLNGLARTLGVSRFSFATPGALEEKLGVPPGSVTPFALINATTDQVRVILDEGLLDLDPLNFHPLRNDRTTAIATTDFLRFVRACGHEPLIMAIPQRP